MRISVGSGDARDSSSTASGKMTVSIQRSCPRRFCRIARAPGQATRLDRYARRVSARQTFTSMSARRLVSLLAVQ
jgi:hypothetical protein